MAGYTQTFGGQNIFPADVSLLQLNPLTANATLFWPTEQALPGANVFADIIEVTPNAGLSITMPDARNATTGQATLINNLGANTVTIKDNLGNVIGSVASGQVWQFYLSDNTTQAGTWRTFQFGTGASSAVAAALAGAGLKAITTTLNVKIAPTSTNTTPTNLVDADRATAKIWTGGVGTFNLPNAATVGSDWFIYIRNSGSGNLTVTPPSGTIDGGASKTFPVGSSSIVLTDGTNYFTFGFNQSAQSLFDHIGINVGGAAGDYVLSGGELNRISYTFTGVLTGNRNVVVPTAAQQYWVFNNTTGGFTLSVKTTAGASVLVPQGFSLVLACDGIDVVSYEGTPGSGVIPAQLGGTGTNTVAQGDVLYGSAANVWSKLPKDTNATRYLGNTGAANSPAWTQVDVSNGVTGRLSYANITQGLPRSVWGVTGNATADHNDIQGSTDQVLRVNPAGNALAFGAVNLDGAAAVTGTLGVTNGGTDLSTVNQGDILYASGANVIAGLAKDATGLKVLTNQGASNAPAWAYDRFTAQAAANSDYTFALTDQWSWTPHTGAATQNWTVPANGTVAFPVGTMLGVDNRAGAGALTMKAASGVTVDGQGATVTGAPTTFFVLPPGYKMILVKMLSDTWLFLTDAPATSGAGAVFRGYVGSDGTTGNRLPAGWSAVRNSAGNYTVTHNLGLADLTRLAVGLSCIGTTGNKAAQQRSSGTGNTFVIETVDSGTGTLTDEAFSFVAALT